MTKRRANKMHAQLPGGRLDVAGAANHLGYSPSWMNRARSEGKGPRYIRAGGKIFYRIEDLDAYLAGCIVETTDSRRAAA